MCIAAVIFKPVSLKYLTEMDNDNPHGGGLACVKEGRIWFIKGLDAKAVFGLQEAGALSYPYLLHFRWATQGARIPELCHPFPVGPRALLGETVGFAERVLIHNGTWHGYNKYIPLSSEIPQDVINHVSDTALAAWLLPDNPDLLNEVSWATAVAEMKNGEMDITTRGTWTEHGGNWYSNLNWLPVAEASWAEWYKTSKWGRQYSSFKPAPRQLLPGPTEPSPNYHVGGERVAGNACEIPQDSKAFMEMVEKHFDKSMAADDDEGPLAANNSAATVKRMLDSRGIPLSFTKDVEDLNEMEPSDPYEAACAGWGNSKSYDSWEDYVRAKYGDEAGDMVAEDDAKGGFEKQTLEEALADLDIVSEDPSEVNSILARQMLREVG